MSVFDLMFIFVLLGSVGTAISAAILAYRGDATSARRILNKSATAVCVYLTTVIIASVILPRKELSVGEPECFDDWCITVERVSRTPAPSNTTYVVTLKLSSRARGVAQRENDLEVYLTDDDGGRYDPIPEPSDVPFSILLQPNESVVTTRSFRAPADGKRLGLVIRHEGRRFPIAWLIVGYDTWFRKPDILWIHSQT